MSGDGPRPSVPHAMTRPRTDRARTLATADDAPTVREPDAPMRAELEEMAAVLRDPAGVTVESFLKLLAISQRHASAAQRQADKLGVDLGVGRVQEEFASIRDTLVGKRRRREWAGLIGSAVGAMVSAALIVWMIVAPRAREAAEVAVIAPAIEAKRVAVATADRTDDHEARILAMERAQEEILGAIEKLNGAVVMVIDRLPEPEPQRIEVPGAITKPRRGKKAGLDE